MPVVKDDSLVVAVCLVARRVLDLPRAEDGEVRLAALQEDAQELEELFVRRVVEGVDAVAHAPVVRGDRYRIVYRADAEPQIGLRAE